MGIQGAAELLSLSLSVTVVFLCAFTVRIFYTGLLNWWKKGSERDAQDWLIAGIGFGFIADKVDNAYWLIPWTSKFLGLEYTGALMSFGVFSNIPFRQLLGGFSAYCHLRGHHSFGENKSNQHNVKLQWALVAGLSYAFILLLSF